MLLPNMVVANIAFRLTYMFATLRIMRITNDGTAGNQAAILSVLHTFKEAGFIKEEETPMALDFLFNRLSDPDYQLESIDFMGSKLPSGTRVDTVAYVMLCKAVELLKVGENTLSNLKGAFSSKRMLHGFAYNADTGEISGDVTECLVVCLPEGIRKAVTFGPDVCWISRNDDKQTYMYLVYMPTKFSKIPMPGQGELPEPSAPDAPQDCRATCGADCMFFLASWGFELAGDNPDTIVVLLATLMGTATVFIWVRATLPRYRYDQLMRLDP
jgi:NADH dehydrogenase